MMNEEVEKIHHLSFIILTLKTNNQQNYLLIRSKSHKPIAIPAKWEKIV
jgi:hypothetical protein